MTSLRDVLTAHAPVLLVDAASSLVQVAWLARDEPPRWHSSTAESGIAIFECLGALGVDVNQAGGFVFCDGPGSILGIRTAAMAIRTWNVLKPRPVFAYTGIALVAHALGRPELGVIVDARRDSWHVYQTGSGLRRLDAARLPAELATPEHFRHWAALPPHAALVSYDLAALLPRVAELDLLRPTEAPDAFLHEEPGYLTWTPHIHRAPAG
jgi:tRNA threonylcarbamoyladenosine biosynthesis protein TsaB